MGGGGTKGVRGGGFEVLVIGAGDGGGTGA